MYHRRLEAAYAHIGGCSSFVALVKKEVLCYQKVRTSKKRA